MRIAVFVPDREQRYHVSHLAEEALLRRGILPEVALFPTFGELSEKAVRQENAFDLAFISGARDASALKDLCGKLPVILIGEKDDGISAYDVGAKYFIVCPIEANSIDKALSRCLS